MSSNMNNDFRRVLSLIIAKDPAAAGEVRILARRLDALADQLDARASRDWQSDGGMGDRVKISVTNPSGFTILKDTGYDATLEGVEL